MGAGELYGGTRPAQDPPEYLPAVHEIDENWALVAYPESWSGLIDLPIESKATRHGEIVRAEPNTNLLYPRTLIPTLIGAHEPGEHWLACGVIAVPGSTNPDRYWQFPPLMELDHANRAVFCKDHTGGLISKITFGSESLY